MFKVKDTRHNDNGGNEGVLARYKYLFATRTEIRNFTDYT